MKLTHNYHEADIITHNGTFHADELFALNFYEAATGQDVTVYRADRIPEDFHGVCIDIGDTSGRDDLQIFDHHKIYNCLDVDKPAAISLVFDYFEEQLKNRLFDNINPDLSVQFIKQDIIQPIKYQDNFGCTDISEQQTYDRDGNVPPLHIKPVSISTAIKKLNPTFNNIEKENEKFIQAYNHVKNIVRAYCESLNWKIDKGIYKTIVGKSNFYSSNFKCSTQYLDKSNYIYRNDDAYYNIIAAKKGYTVYHGDTRICTVGDLFTIGHTNEIEAFMSDVMDGYKDFQQGYYEAEKIATDKIKETAEKGESVLVLDKFLPWRSATLSANKDKEINAAIDFVIFPSSRDNGSWNIQAVYGRNDDCKYRIPFPEELFGKNTEELEKYSEGLLYVSDFLSCAKDFESAYNFANKLVDLKRNIEIPEGITSTEELSFSIDDIKSIKSITFPSSFEEIKPKAFMFASNLKELTIPSNVKIGTNAFTQCNNLETLTIEPGIHTIGYFAFSDCKKLKNITLPDTIHNLDKNVFLNGPIENVTIEITDFHNIINLPKIKSAFKGADIKIDCSNLGSETYDYDCFMALVSEVNSRIKAEQHSERKKTLDEMIADCSAGSLPTNKTDNQIENDER